MESQYNWLEMLSALLALCEENNQWQMMKSSHSGLVIPFCQEMPQFDAFFVVRLNKVKKRQLSYQEFEMVCCSHDVTVTWVYMFPVLLIVILCAIIIQQWYNTQGSYHTEAEAK